MMDKNKIKEFFDRWAPSWDDDLVRDEEIINTILDNAEVKEGKDILDVACGTGVLIEDYHKRKAASITAIDISEKMIGIAKAKYPDISFICADAENYSCKQRFDCIIIYNAFPHFSDTDKLIGNLKILLKDGGILSIAHSASRDRINAHHSNVMEISRLLPPVEELKESISSYLSVILAVDDERMYQLVAQKK